MGLFRAGQLWPSKTQKSIASGYLQMPGKRVRMIVVNAQKGSGYTILLDDGEEQQQKPAQASGGGGFGGGQQAAPAPSGGGGFGGGSGREESYDDVDF